jgi:hypothetical protein
VHPNNPAFSHHRWTESDNRLPVGATKENAMTTVTLKDKAANMGELSLNELDQVTGGHNGNTGGHGGDALPVFMQIAAAVGVVGGFIAGIIGSIIRGE